MSEWISVEDSFPEEGQLVICRGTNCVGVCYFGDLQGSKMFHHGKLFRLDPSKCAVDSDGLTHWMPLPQPPEETK